MDYRVAEYSRLLPYAYMINGDLGLKRILKDILYEMVPRDLLDTVSHDNLTNLLPELDADKFIALRDAFVNVKDISSRMFFTAYTYIKWFNKYM